LLNAVEETEGSGIVYVSSRRHAEEIAGALEERGISCSWYHGGMRSKDRAPTQDEFMKDGCRVMVATSAFGMGVDKSCVRFVFHYDVPDSIDSYYQEIGRAGRDGEPAEAILFYRPEDLAVQKFLNSGGKVAEEQILEVAAKVHEAGEPLAIGDLKDKTDLSARKLEKTINRLEEAGVVERLPSGEVASVADAPPLDEAAGRAAREEADHREYQMLRIEKMRAYAELLDCRREYLLEYFGQPAEACGHCDNCTRPPAPAQSPGREAARPASSDGPFPVKSRVLHRELGKGVVDSYEGDKIIVLFDEGGRKTMSLAFVTERELLQAAS
jgi:ATP-dependent DNA helicase RecQ